MKLTGVVSFVRPSVSSLARPTYVTLSLFLSLSCRFAFPFYLCGNTFRKQQILPLIDPSETVCFTLKVAFDSGANFAITCSRLVLTYFYIISPSSDGVTLRLRLGASSRRTEENFPANVPPQ